MSEDPTRRYGMAGMAGDEIKAEVQVDHSANFAWIGAFFTSGEAEEEQRRGAPEVSLDWSQENPYDKPPVHGRYRPPENIRSSTYELRGTIPAETPPGVYRLWQLSFQTVGGRLVRLDRERLGIDAESFVVEVLDEHPENTRPIRFGFTHEE